MNRKHSESALLDLLDRVLKAIPTVDRLRWELEPRPGIWKYDARLSLVLKSSRSPQRWLVETKGQPLEPLKAELFALQLAAARTAEGATYAVLVAPFVSPRAAEVLARHDVGFVDAAGNCRLSVSQLYVERTGFPNPVPRKPFQRSLFSRASERVLRALLDPSPGGRNNPKDAYDIFFCLKNHPLGVQGIAERLRPYIKDHEVNKAISILASKFRDLKDYGPATVARFFGSPDIDLRAFQARDAFEQVSYLLRSLGWQEP